MADLAAPRFEEFGPVLIAGMGQRYNDETSVGIPALWQRFDPHIGHIPGQLSGKTYGVMWPLKGAEGFEYVCGVEVSDLSAVPAEFSRLTLEKQKYAVFSHTALSQPFAIPWVRSGINGCPHRPCGSPKGRG